MAGSSSRMTTALLVIGMVLSGTMNTVVMKIQFTLTSTGTSGELKPFSKPWYGTFNMLFAMALVLAVEQLLSGCYLCRANKGETLLGDVSPRHRNDARETGGRTWRQKVVLTSIPSVFDLLATVLGCMGVLYIPASIFQMLRGSCIIFTALFAVLVLKRRLISANWLGLFLVVLGVTLVSLANVLGEKAGAVSSAGSSGGAGSGEDAAKKATDNSLAMLGIVLTLLGQVVQAAQVIAEEWLLKDLDLPPMQIIGFEGLWGMLIMICLIYPVLYMLPGSDDGHLEDPFGTLVMVQNNPYLMLCAGLYLCSCGTLNATGIAVTGALSGVLRMMLDALRTLGIWAFFLFVHYFVDESSPFGETLTPYSGLQLLGFVVLVLGQAVYGEVVRVPGLHYPPVAFSAATFASPGAAANFASPLPMRE